MIRDTLAQRVAVTKWYAERFHKLRDTTHEKKLGIMGWTATITTLIIMILERNFHA